VDEALKWKWKWKCKLGFGFDCNDLDFDFIDGLLVALPTRAELLELKMGVTSCCDGPVNKCNRRRLCRGDKEWTPDGRSCEAGDAWADGGRGFNR